MKYCVRQILEEYARRVFHCILEKFVSFLSGPKLVVFDAGSTIYDVLEFGLTKQKVLRLNEKELGNNSGSFSLYIVFQIVCFYGVVAQ